MKLKLEITAEDSDFWYIIEYVIFPKPNTDW